MVDYPKKAYCLTFRLACGKQLPIYTCECPCFGLLTPASVGFTRVTKINIWLNQPIIVNKYIWSDLSSTEAQGWFSNSLHLTFMLHNCIRSSGHFWLTNKDLILGREEWVSSAPQWESEMLSSQNRVCPYMSIKKKHHKDLVSSTRKQRMKLIDWGSYP